MVGFIRSMQSHVNVTGSTFQNIVSSHGIFYSSDGSKLFIDSCKFTNLVGVDISGFIFSIQNLDGDILLKNSLIEDSISSNGLISLTFSKIEIHGCEFRSNYGKLSSNGISMVFSHVKIYGSTIDNTMNNLENSADSE